MQQPLPSSTQANSIEDRCPGCLSMKLQGTRVQPDRIDLYLTINFNEQSEPLVGGSVSFGLKGGELKLKLDNGSIPYEYRELTGSLQLSQGSTSNNLEVAAAQRQAIVSANVETGATEDTANPCPLVRFQGTTKGSQQNPAWVFTVETGESILKGSLNNTKLATLKAIALPCSVEATFDVSLQDVYLTQTQGLWSSSISRNQKAVLEKGIARLLLKQKLKPYLSRVELRYD